MERARGISWNSLRRHVWVCTSALDLPVPKISPPIEAFVFWRWFFICFLTRTLNLEFLGGQSLTKNENSDVAVWKEIAEDVHKDVDRLFKVIEEAYEVLSDPNQGHD
ncbi:hypothetical protein ACS0TY_012918 [Phlomoides rotata]